MLYLAGIDERGLVNAVRTAVALDEEGSLPQDPVPDYADENVSTKVLRSFSPIRALSIRWSGASGSKELWLSFTKVEI